MGRSMDTDKITRQMQRQRQRRRRGDCSRLEAEGTVLHTHQRTTPVLGLDEFSKHIERYRQSSNAFSV
jgi:hypothetical protein